MDKIQKGDYTPNLTEDQFNELLDIENYTILRLSYFKTLGLMFNGDSLLHDHAMFGLENKLTFEDFKQRAINTFGNGTKE